tara:strand:- start:2641 stop:3003 length:363 start_codon:yes stop_codon:yes gene_type:complete
MTKENKILEIIGGTKEQYHNLLLTNYMQWCMVQSQGSDSMLQEIMTDGSINKWYCLELAKLETSFLENVAPIANHKYINYKLTKQMYMSTIQLIVKIFPAPLLANYKITHNSQLKKFIQN